LARWAARGWPSSWEEAWRGCRARTRQLRRDGGAVVLEKAVALARWIPGWGLDDATLPLAVDLVSPPLFPNRPCSLPS
jgi:hypothetical protein